MSVSDKNFLADPIESSPRIAGAVLSVIAECDDSVLDVVNKGARRAIENACLQALFAVARSDQRVVVLPETIPGFALMAFRLQKEKVEPARVKENVVGGDAIMAADLIKGFVSKSGSRVISIQGADVVILLFPSEDLSKHLADLGLR